MFNDSVCIHNISSTVHPLHELNARDLQTVNAILDKYEAAWRDDVPDIDQYVTGVDESLLPTLLEAIVQIEAAEVTARGLFPQPVLCATTPELEYAVSRGRQLGDMQQTLVSTLKDIILPTALKTPRVGNCVSDSADICE